MVNNESRVITAHTRKLAQSTAASARARAVHKYILPGQQPYIKYSAHTPSPNAQLVPSVPSDGNIAQIRPGRELGSGIAQFIIYGRSALALCLPFPAGIQLDEGEMFRCGPKRPDDILLPVTFS